MALALFDRVQETTTTTGTGSVTLGGAVPGFQSFAVVGNGNTCYYTIVDGTAWEVGIGTYSTSGPTLARTTVLSNSSGTTSPITLAAGTKTIFLTYPAEKSVNLDASGNVSPLGTVSSGVWQGSTVGVAYGGTGVTSSSGANSVMLRDANQNVSINRLNQSSTTITAAGTTTTLTAASTFSQILVGTGGQTFKLPDATTLTNTTTFEFNNNATGTLTITDNANATIGTITSGGAAAIALLSNGTVGGTWDVHAYIPENVTWGTNSLALSTTVITGGTWNGGTIQPAYGGTGLTSYTSGGAVYANSSSTLTSGTLPVTAGGTGNTTGQAASTTASATFNSGGAGDASGTTFNGSTARTISYNTIGAPSTSGTNATGTWGISISGNATTTSQTNFSNLTIGGSQVLYAGNYSSYALPLTGGAVTGGIGISGSYTTYSSQALTLGNDATYAYIQSWGSRALWLNPQGNSIFAGASGSTVLTSGNYNSYAPTLTGTGATGTWAINISGNAATATSSTSSTTATTAVNLSGGPIVTGGTSQPYIQLNASTYPTSYPSYFGVRSDASGDLRMGNNNVNDFVAGTTGVGGYFRFYVNNTNTFPTAPNGTLALTMASSGSVTASVDSRAPIFYDSNNTAYYVDPSSSSISAVFAGPIVAAGGLQSATSGYTSPYNIFTLSNTYNTSTYYGIKYVEGNPDVIQIIGGNNVGLSIGMDVGDTTASSSLRAPIFYDSDNTGYYLNPNGTSNVSGDFIVNQSGSSGIQLKSTTGTQSLWIRTGWNGAPTPSVLFNNVQFQSSGSSGGSFTFWSGNDLALTITSDYAQGAGSLRAPIFYDSDNTAYYLNAASTSNLNAVNYNGVLSWADGTYALGSPSYGFRFNDTASTINAFIISNAGVTTSYASSRAPIFYDSNNTGYYGDFASTSLFNILNFPSGSQSINTTTPGTATYQLNFTGQGTSDYAQAITWGWSGSGAQAGIYVQSSGSYGTKMYIATTDSFATGSKTAMSIDHVGTIQVPRSYLQSDTSLRAPIFYDSNDTGYYVNPNGMSYIASVQIAGYNTASSALMLNWPTSGYIGVYGSVVNSAKLLNFRGTGGDSYRVSTAQLGGAAYVNGDDTSGNGSAGVIIAPGGARYATTASVVTGAIKITLPEPVTDVMCTMTIRVYTYDGSAYEITCGGYPYGTAGGTGFVNTFAYMNTQRRGTLTVRFGTDGSNACIWIGETGTSWNYPQVAVIDFTTGYYGRDPKHYADGWGISFVSSFNTVFNSINVYAPANTSANSAAVYAPVFYDSNDTTYYVDPNSTSNLAQVNLQSFLRRNTSAAGYLEGNYGTSTDGNSSACIYTIGGSYQPSTTTLGNMYGIGYTVGNGTSNPGLGQTGWGLYVASAGGSRIFLDSDSGVGVATASWRAPIFYDKDNTGYYVDPAPGTNGVSANFQGRIQLGTFNNSQTNSGEAWLGRASDRNSGTCTVQLGGGSSSSRSFEVVDYAWTVVLGSINSDGNSYAYTSYRAPIFYDRDNTGYYCDPASTSNFNQTNSQSLWIQTYGASTTPSLILNSPGPWINIYGTGTSTQQVNFAAYGSANLCNISATGNVTAYASDRRLKTNIRPIENALEKVLSLNGVVYNWNNVAQEYANFDTTIDEVGIFAQDAKAVQPEVVKPAPFDVDHENNTSKSGENYLTVQYERLVPLLIEAIKELSAKVDAFEKRT